jgi:hypothetical protein
LKIAAMPLQIFGQLLMKIAKAAQIKFVLRCQAARPVGRLDVTLVPAALAQDRLFGTVLPPLKTPSVQKGNGPMGEGNFHLVRRRLYSASSRSP